MNRKPTLVVATILALSAVPCASADDASTTRPSRSATTRPVATAPAATQPAQVVATVGELKITQGRIDEALKDVPAQYRPRMRPQALNRIIVQELVRAYVKANKIAPSKNALEAIKGQFAEEAGKEQMTGEQLMAKLGVTEEQLREEAAVRTMIDEATSEQNVAAFIRSNPSFFDGTTVQASHILIACSPVSKTKEQQAAIEKLRQIKADIQAAKTTFAEAAKKHSTCSNSKEKGGDLGEFKFEQMVAPFAVTAFNMKPDEISNVVRTQFGFHLLLVTKKTKGKSPATKPTTQSATTHPSPEQHDLAARTLMGLLQNRIFDQVMTTCPIVIHEK